MNIVKRTLAIAAILLTSFSVSATLINVGGVQWDPDESIDFKGITASLYQEIDAGTGEISGYGRITSLNDNLGGDICPGCELTYNFGGFTPNALPDGNAISYMGGWMKFWVDYSIEVANPNAISSMTFETTGDGDLGLGDGPENELWLELEGHEFTGVNTTFLGISVGAIFPPITPSLLLGAGYFDVVGGLAMGNFDTNTIITADSPEEGNADISFTSTFTTFPSAYTATGAATFKGNSIPEPTSLAIFALGLIALAIGVRNKRV